MAGKQVTKSTLLSMLSQIESFVMGGTMKKNLKLMIYTALMTAFVFVTTFSIKVPVPFTNGYIHMGDMCIFVSGVLLGPWYGAFAAGVGSMFADILGGYAHWALPTLLIKGVMGYLVGYFALEKPKQKWVLFGGMGIWLISLIAFLISVKKTDVGFLVEHVEELANVENVLTFLSTFSYQLIGAAIGMPLLSLLFFKLRDRYGISFGQLSGMLLAGIWMVLGYYVAAGIMYGSFLAPIFSIPWNIVQFGCGIILGFVILAGLKKANVKIEQK